MVQTYKCPGCGAPLGFRPGADELVCEFCGTHVKTSELNDETDRYEYTVENQVDNSAQERQDMSSYVCQSCGAQLIVDETTSATTCCYCGSPALVKERLSGVLKPAWVIPFKHSKDEAKEIFRKWICHGFFTPSVFKKTATIEQVKGIYVPFWLYDYKAESDAVAQGTKIVKERRGDTVTEHTDYYQLFRKCRSTYSKVPADASEKMPDDIMDMMEPYDYSGIKDFEMPYLSGFESEKYSYESDNDYMVKRVEDRVSTYLFKEVKKTMKGYGHLQFLRNDVSLSRTDVKYALLPVWLLTYRYKGENKIFAMNGQTGKQIGTLPNSKEKMWGTFAAVMLGIAFVLRILGGLLG